MLKNFDEMYKYLKENNAEYLLNFYNELSEDERESLFEQIEKIDFDLMRKLYNARNTPPVANKKIESIQYIKIESLADEQKNKYREKGEELLKNGKVAVCQMAGGQGTRLGYSGPKGTYTVALKTPKTIFEIFADKIKETCNKYNVKILWLIMTSEQNDKETKLFFEKNNYFNYGKENIMFFSQKELPILDFDGNYTLSAKDKVFMAANGNGGIYDALHAQGILEKLKEKGIEYLGIGNVDNILLDMLEPTFIGMMNLENKELAVKTVTKTSPEEKVGVVCKLNGKPGVVEYTEITEKMANEKDENNNLKFGEAYYGFVMFKVSLLEKIVQGLEYRPAKKKNSYIDKNGKMIIGEQPNTYKFEMFIFDGFEVADDMLVLSVKREENFAPIKNKDGVDSPTTAIELYNNYYFNNKF